MRSLAQTTPGPSCSLQNRGGYSISDCKCKNYGCLRERLWAVLVRTGWAQVIP